MKTERFGEPPTIVEAAFAKRLKPNDSKAGSAMSEPAPRNT